MRRLLSGLMLLVTLSTVVSIAHAEFILNVNSGGLQPLGKTVSITVDGSPADPNDRVDYRLSVKNLMSAEPGKLIFDYSTVKDLEWTPFQEGLYLIIVSVRVQDDVTGDYTYTRLTSPVNVSSRVSTQPLVNPTANPLVALYSAPACPVGDSMRVLFVEQGTTQMQVTDTKPCLDGLTMNFYIAGMHANSTYVMHHLLFDGNGAVIVNGPNRQFHTGDPSEVLTVDLPIFQVSVPPSGTTSTADRFLLVGPTPRTGQDAVPAAADLNGNIVWFYTKGVSDGEFLLTRLLDGGYINMIGTAAPDDRFTMRQIDLAGNTIRQTSSRRLSEQLAAMGQSKITNIHHEVRALPNGYTAVLASTERLLQDVQGPGLVDVIGDIVIVLDENWQVVWSDNLFDILDNSRTAVLGETCVSGGPGCPIVALADEANDWTHSNAISYSPADGNLIISMRHQDWIAKVDYADGTGNGALIWLLGKDGDFTINSSETDPWFSHQHDANYMSDNKIILYDNGNANFDCPNTPMNCKSRGQVYELNESTMEVTPILSADLNNFSFAVGAAHVLSNGNFHFNSGLAQGGGHAQGSEVDPSGQIIYDIETNKSVYRSFRLRSMYFAPR